ncbi:IS3 family transposase, partial [Clostridium estertheticum]|uniref:IS3 family transposase n=1 Tax=Clostridium estertheticum TaxID=238834 RepID=UPI001CF58705
MSKILFTKKDIIKLEKNKNVKNVSEYSITYNYEFKILFIDEYIAGKLPRQIFAENGFDIDVIGLKRIEQSAYRWNSAYKKDGIIGLEDTRKTASGRPRSTELTKEEIIVRQNARINLLEAQVELLKKLDAKERQVVQKNKKIKSSDAFKTIKEVIEKYSFVNVVGYLCELSGVSRSGYYNYIASKDIRVEREQRDLEDRDLILKAFNRRGYKKGSRSIKMILVNEFNITYSLKRIRRIMNKYEIICPHRKANPYRRIAKATKEHSVVKNILNREFKQATPGKVLLTDITYLPYGNSKMAYLSTIKDSSTNEILAYQTSDRITLDIALDTINKLVKNRRVTLTKDAFIHSDQGSHYTSPTFQKLLKKHKLSQSMSRRGNCWDNAPQESFFGHMKDEIDLKSCTTLEHVKKMIDRYIKYYNNYRYQWNLKKMTPVQ